MAEITTLHEIVGVLGGPGPVARSLGLRRANAVSNWYRRGIPARHWVPLAHLAQTAGLTDITPESFQEINKATGHSDGAK